MRGDFDQLGHQAHPAHLLKALGGSFAIQIAAQDNGVTGKKAFQAHRIVDAEQFSEALFRQCRLFAGQYFAAKGEVKPVQPAPESTVASELLSEGNLRAFPLLFQRDGR
ncbi:MAG: hypothetical protein U5K56_19875 [Halioglobus sp.]|nr:hypothetical protein [Halioglobus sp.]